MKVYARQINPSYQESPLMIFDEWPEDLIVTGNRDYRTHTNWEWKKIMDDFDDMASEWSMNGMYGSEKYSLKEILEMYGFERNDGKPWTTNQRHEWKLMMEDKYNDSRDDEIILKALKLMTGFEWKFTTIRGCCQGDWQNVYYRVDRWNKKSLEAFEAEYFNTGSEWMIHDPTIADGIEEVPENPEDVNGFCGYCYSWNEDGIREEIANMAGCKPEDVVMWAWDGTNYNDRYRMVV